MKANTKKSALTLVAESLIAEKAPFNVELQCSILAREIVGYDAKNKEVQEIKKQLDNARDERGARKNEINKLLVEFRNHGITLGKDARTCKVKKALKTALVNAGLTDGYAANIVDAVKFAIDTGCDYDIHAREKAKKAEEAQKLKDLQDAEKKRLKELEKENKQREKEKNKGETPPTPPASNTTPPASNTTPPASNTTPPASNAPIEKATVLTVAQLKSNFLKIVPNMIVSTKATREKSKSEFNNSVLDELLSALNNVLESVDNLGSGE